MSHFELAVHLKAQSLMDNARSTRSYKKRSAFATRSTVDKCYLFTCVHGERYKTLCILNIFITPEMHKVHRITSDQRHIRLCSIIVVLLSAEVQGMHSIYITEPSLYPRHVRC